MIKKGISILLCCGILFTGCGQSQRSNNTINNTDIDTKSNVEQKVEKVVKEAAASSSTRAFPLVWKDMSEYSNEKVEYIPTNFTPKVPAYSIDSNLSNIDNISQFTGLTNDQMKKLANNGFVVLNPNPEKAYYYMKMYDIYEENEYKNIPNFITVDVALHIYHKFFDETLKSVEKDQLDTALQQLTENMLNKSIVLYSKTENQSVKKDLGSVMTYFSVGNKLINDSYGNIPEEYLSVAKKEIELIKGTAGYEKSPLFNFDINYEQFIVRGHYAGDEQLEQYFKTMMWYGLIGYPFEKNGKIDYDSIDKAMMITYISFLQKDDVDDIALWDTIYAPTNFFVGQSDDVTIFDLQEVMMNVYGKDVTLEDIKNEKYHTQLIEELSKLPGPQIQNKLITGVVNTPTNKQFRFMGQRYTLDANIMQVLMVPITRPVPTGLDVAGAFGSERGETLAKENYLDKWPEEEYTAQLQKMKDKVNNLEQEDWQKNMYNGWLWVLKSIWEKEENTDGLPLFMKNQPWEDKNIQTGLGSYAELKHDTVLYAKQPVAEMGGGEEPKIYYPNYVEPNVEVYDRLLWLIKYSKVNLENRGLLSDRSKRALDGLEEIYQLFRECSVKELENIPITEEENIALKYIGGKLESIDDALSDEYQQSISSAVVSDVAGIADIGFCLEVGTGLPNEILVGVYNNGKVYIARGSVYSYYEFLNEKPLTDQQWHERLGVETVEEEGWSYETINSDMFLKNAPDQPSWIGSFKSFEDNSVTIPDVEYEVTY